MVLGYRIWLQKCIGSRESNKGQHIPLVPNGVANFPRVPALPAGRAGQPPARRARCWVLQPGPPPLCGLGRRGSLLREAPHRTGLVQGALMSVKQGGVNPLQHSPAQNCLAVLMGGVAPPVPGMKGRPAH